ncbi:MAG: hypothetical protein QXR62_04615 [Candidatus Bathyarchaeia archaeon]
MMSDVQLTAQRIASELSSFFKTPPPRIVFLDTPNPGYYEDGTIYLSTKLTPENLERVLAHEYAHHSHVYYGIPCRTPECEAYARMFEELWMRMKRRQKAQIYSCPSCGYPLLFYSNTAKCLRCHEIYKLYRVKQYRMQGDIAPIIAKAILTGLGGALLTSIIYGKFPPKTREEMGALVGATVASSFVGLLASLAT